MQSGNRAFAGLTFDRAGLAVALLAAVLVPLLANALWLKVLTSVIIFMLTSASIAFLYRGLGLVSLGQVALMGCGGWVTLRLAHAFHTPFELNMLAGGIYAMFLGMAMAYPAMRMRSLYLALVTLMGAAIFAIAIGIIQFPNGGGGWSGFEVKSIDYIERPMLASGEGGYFAFCVIVVVLGFALIHWHENGKPGRAWAMIRRSEATAMSVGIDVTRYKLWACSLSGFLAGIAGALLAGSLQFLDARSFPVAESVMIFALTIVGGAWNWLGALLAAVLYRLVPALFNDIGINGDAAYLVFGIALIHALMTAPRGLAGQLQGLFAKLSGKQGGAA